MIIIYESRIRRLIKFDEKDCCDSCHEDMDDGYAVCELDEIDLGYDKCGEERFAEVCCQVHKAFIKWSEEKRNLRGVK